MHMAAFVWLGRYCLMGWTMRHDAVVGALCSLTARPPTRSAPGAARRGTPGFPPRPRLRPSAKVLGQPPGRLRFRASIAQKAGHRCRQCGCWDQALTALDGNLNAAAEAYTVRERARGMTSVLIDGYHFELPKALYPA